MIKNKKNFLFLLAVIVLLAAGCAKVQLQQTVPTSPKESYEQLPR
jgi:outer membrane biogenesis lipoprotein LolB